MYSLLIFYGYGCSEFRFKNSKISLNHVFSIVVKSLGYKTYPYE